MAQSPPIDGRGHNADKPSEIPKPGWLSIFRRVYTSTSDKNLSVLAAGVAFYGMLSVFPALAVLVAIYGLFADPATVQHQINTVRGLIPALRDLVSVSSSAS